MKKWTRCIHNSTPNLSLDQWKYVPLEKYSSLNKKSSLTSNQGLGPRNLGWTFYGEFFFKGNIVLDTWNLCFWKKWPSLGLWNTLSLSLSLCVVSLISNIKFWMSLYLCVPLLSPDDTWHHPLVDNVGSDMILGWYEEPLFKIWKWWQINKQTNWFSTCRLVKMQQYPVRKIRKIICKNMKKTFGTNTCCFNERSV